MVLSATGVLHRGQWNTGRSPPAAVGGVRVGQRSTGAPSRRRSHFTPSTVGEDDRVFRRRTPEPTEPEPVHDGPSPVRVVTDETFFDVTEGGWTVVDFWAAWCAPCRTFAPVYEAVARAHDGPVRFASCDVDANPRTAELLQIRSIPTLVVFGPDGSEVGRSQGAVSRGDLEATVRQLAAR